MSSQFLKEILSVWGPQPHLLSPKLQVRVGKLKDGSLPTPPNTIVEAERWVGDRADTSFLVPSAEVGISTLEQTGLAQEERIGDLSGATQRSEALL